MSQTEKQPPSRTRRARLWRALRILVLMVFLVFLCAAIYLNLIGLPAPVQSWLREDLRSRGVLLTFQDLRWRWFEGIVAEGVKWSMDGGEGPSGSVESAAIRLDWSHWKTGTVGVSGMELEGGTLQWPLPGGGDEKPMEAWLDRMRVRFLGDNQLEIESCQGRVFGIALGLTAELSHLKQFKNWNWGPDRPKPEQPPRWPDQLRSIQSLLNRLNPSEPPVLALHVVADGAVPGKASAHLTLSAGALAGDPVRASKLTVEIPARLVPDRDGLIQGPLMVRVQDLQVQEDWTLDEVVLTGDFSQSIREPLPDKVRLRTKVEGLSVAEGRGRAKLVDARIDWTLKSGQDWSAQLDVQVEKPSWEPVTADRVELHLTANGRKEEQWVAGGLGLSLVVEHPSTPWGRSEDLELKVHVEEPLPQGNLSVNAPAEWPDWARELVQRTPDLECVVHRFERIPGPASVDQLRLLASAGPEGGRLRELSATIGSGTLSCNGKLAWDTREAVLQMQSDLPITKVAPWFREKTRAWLARNVFAAPPEVTARLAWTLPPWGEKWPDWETGILPAWHGTGQIRTGPASYQNVPYLQGSSDIALTNSVLILPNLTIRRPEGRMRLDYSEHLRTKEYRWDVHGLIRPDDVTPLIASDSARQALEEFDFHMPAFARGTVWGTWGAPELTGLDLQLDIQDFVYREVPLNRFQGRVDFTNGVLRGHLIDVSQADRGVRADGLTIRVEEQRLWLTNVFSNMDPLVVAGVIGPMTRSAIEPFQFLKPPEVRVEGSISLKEVDSTDLKFQVKGGPFHYLDFRLPNVRADLHWVTNQLAISNASGSFYGGEIRGGGHFQLNMEGGGSVFQFRSAYTNVEASSLLHDLFGPENTIEGTVQGTLNITNALSQDPLSWMGDGQVLLRNGFIWDIPLFGMFSPMLNQLAPGLGKSRIREAIATFAVSNSVVHTPDLVLSSPAMRLNYDGSIDLQGQVNARVEAELFRDSGLFGKVFATALSPITKILEYRVTGNVRNPVKEPIHIPRILLAPLQPFRTLRELFGSQDDLPDPPPPENNPAPDP